MKITLLLLEPILQFKHENIHLVHRQNFPKNNISYSLTITGTCAYEGVRNGYFSSEYAYVPNE